MLFSLCTVGNFFFVPSIPRHEDPSHGTGNKCGLQETRFKSRFDLCKTELKTRILVLIYLLTYLLTASCCGVYS